MKKIILHITRFLLALAFIYSAYSKLFPAEPFELYVFSLGFLNWLNTTIAVRLLIALELFIGLSLIINIYTKQILKLTLGLLIGFTIYLIYITIFNSVIEDCGCFGDKLKLTPIESIIKNIILLFTSVFLYLKNKTFNLIYNKLIISISLIISIALPFILSPPDGFIDTELKNILTKNTIDSEIIGDFTQNNKQLSFKRRKAIVCFFSTTCPFCKKAAQKLSIITKSNNIKTPIFYIFFGSKKALPQFWKDSKSIKFPYKFIDTKTFFTYSGSSLPSIMFIDNERIINHIGYRGLDDKVVINFIKN